MYFLSLILLIFRYFLIRKITHDWPFIFILHVCIGIFTRTMLYFFLINYSSVEWPWASLVAQLVKNLSSMQKIRVWFLGQEDPLEKEMATHFSILAWRIPWTEKAGRPQSLGSQELDMTKRWQLVFSQEQRYISCWFISANNSFSILQLSWIIPDSESLWNENMTKRKSN